MGTMTGLRRKEKAIKDKSEVEAVLREATVGRLGTSRDGTPYVVPVSYVYDDGKIIIHGAKQGKKMEDIASNPRVCFEVDESEIIASDDPCNYSYRYQSVIANGTARILEDPNEKLDGLRLLTEKYAPGKGLELTDEHFRKYWNLNVVEINIHKMVGKKSPA
jgi:nitroimidazol reductase NimA-like FMN-containing flavoprotein (pyridoxamine 5'-phosphate oxidase superfamily)